MLMGVGILWVSGNLFLGFAELVTLPTIRPPKRQTFAHIRLTATQYQTVFAPAMGALVSGVFVSLSASFFYASFTEQQDSWHRLAGVASLLAGAIALVVTLWSLLRDAGEPETLARDPFSIRAAADESAANPWRGGLDPEVLTYRLNEWEDSISAHSMNLSVKGTSSLLETYLNKPTQKGGSSFSLLHCLKIYYAALLRFPWKFCWPLLGFTILLIGIVGFVIGPTELKFATSLRPWAVIGGFVVGGAVATIFYCAARGNRARLWHAINLVALEKAREAISEAQSAHTSARDQNLLLQKVLLNANKFLQQDSTALHNDERTILRLGKFRLSIR